MTVIVHEEKNELVIMKWGMVPNWTQDIHTAQRPINARAETLSEKPSFTERLKNGAVLFPHPVF